MERLEMPVVRYFLFVGGALLALLFIADAFFPKLPAVEDASSASTVAGGAVADISVIRIHSDRKWPERVEFDTSHPVIIPASVRMAEAAAPPPAIADAPARPGDAFAQLQAPKKPEPKLPSKHRTVARSHRGPPTMLVAQQPRFGFFGNAFW
jgi:hypothetical protein